MLRELGKRFKGKFHTSIKREKRDKLAGMAITLRIIAITTLRNHPLPLPQHARREQHSKHSMDNCLQITANVTAHGEGNEI